MGGSSRDCGEEGQELMHERTGERTNDVTIYFGAVIAVFNKTN